MRFLGPCANHMDSLISAKRLAASLAAFLLIWIFVSHANRPIAPSVREAGVAVADQATVGSMSASSSTQQFWGNAFLSPPRSLSITAWFDDTNNFVSDLLALAGKSPSPEWLARLEQLCAGQSPAVLKKLLMDDELSEALPWEAVQAVFKQLTMSDAPWTGDYVKAMSHGSLRAELLAALLRQWGADDLPSAIKWAQRLQDSFLQQSALTHLSYRWVETDPEGALAFVASHPGEHQQLLTTVVGLWSQEQPEAAANWAVDHSRESGMASVAASAVATWAAIDDLAAAEFVLTLPPGNLRNEAAISVMSALGDDLSRRSRKKLRHRKFSLPLGRARSGRRFDLGQSPLFRREGYSNLGGRRGFDRRSTGIGCYLDDVYPESGSAYPANRTHGSSLAGDRPFDG